MDKKEYGVFGLGKFGATVALTLSGAGYEVVAVDSNEERVDAVADYVTSAMVADVTNPEVLENMGISNLDCVIIAISKDMEASVMTTLLAKEKGVPVVVAKAENTIHKRILEKVGADMIVFPERDMGARLAKNLMGGEFIDLVELSSEFSLVEVAVRKEWVGKSLRQLDMRNRYGLNIIGVKHQETLEVNLSSDAPLEADMILVIVGKNDDLRRLGIRV
ncbi:MAG TPA: TrkA family potassium uptake protein [Candidatus Onthocola gallistercoris]|uniref:TrkA family potassium uptake protein n=1 Tax=Candidatus Onthocola gallistercoris TaxID=2840876 RepID=A0A9D1KYP6_9FIRM|nr:TrkA family potassium uptake protein [Candidatus Onthocola gallistercoris]